MLPSSDDPSRITSERSVSVTTMPRPVVESKSFTTPCMTASVVVEAAPVCNRDRAVSGLGDLAGLQTGGADTNPLGVGAVTDPDALDVGKPAATGAFVREADLLPVPGLFSTDFTAIGHGISSGR